MRKARNQYRRGVAVEYEVREVLRADGWAVMRGAGSKGYWWTWKPDLIASRPHEWRCSGIHAVCTAFEKAGWMIESVDRGEAEWDAFDPECVALKVTRGGASAAWIRTMEVGIGESYPVIDQVLIQVKRGGRACTSRSTHSTRR